MRLTIFKPFHSRRGVLEKFSELFISKIVQHLDLPELRYISKVLVHVRIRISSTLDAALKVPALPLDGESPCCPAWSHPSDLVRNVEESMYCEWARWESFRVVLVVEAGCMDRVSLQFFGNERGERTAHNRPPTDGFPTRFR